MPHIHVYEYSVTHVVTFKLWLLCFDVSLSISVSLCLCQSVCLSLETGSREAALACLACFSICSSNPGLVEDKGTGILGQVLWPWD